MLGIVWRHSATRPTLRAARPVRDTFNATRPRDNFDIAIHSCVLPTYAGTRCDDNKWVNKQANTNIYSAPKSSWANLPYVNMLQSPQTSKTRFGQWSKFCQELRRKRLKEDMTISSAVIKHYEMYSIQYITDLLKCCVLTMVWLTD